MKKTYFKNLMREIGGSFGRFAAVFAISALSVGFLAGLLATTPDMRLSADRYFDEANMMDVRVVSTLGLTDNAIKTLEDTVNVKSVMPSYSVDALFSMASGDTVVGRVHALPKDLSDQNDSNINRVELTDGRMPEKPGECVVQVSGYSSAPVEVGDKIVFSPDNKDLSETIATDPLTVVGLVRSAYYFSFQHETSSIGSGSVDMFLFVQPENFTSEVYTEAYLTFENAKDYISFDKEYKDYAAEQIDGLKEIGIVQSKLRTEEVRGEATAKLNDAKQELADKKEEADVKLLDAKSKLNDGEKKLLDGEKALRSARKQTADGRVAYDKAYAENQAMFVQKQAELDKASADLAAQTKLWQSSKDKTDEAYAQFLAAIPEGTPVQNVPVPEELKAAMAQVESGKAAIDAGKLQLEQGKTAIEQGKIQAANTFYAEKSKLDAGEIKIKRETKKLEKARLTYNEGLAEYEKNKAEVDKKIAEGEDKIFEAEDEIKKIEDAEWYVLGRDTNVSYVSYEQNAEKVAAIAKIFPLFFFLVAALVTVTTMTRMVDEQRTQIGTMKALGYSRGAIAAKYITYAGVACVGGSAAGILVGFKLFPTVIYNAYSMMYNLPKLYTPINAEIAICAAVAAILCGVGSTIAACGKELRETPATLMRPKAPPAGKRILLERITPLWKRMKFTQKVTARNLIRYKKRFFMTIIGVAGCTALLVTGFGLRDSIGDIIGRQFGGVYKYNLMVGVKHQRAFTRNEDIAKVLNDKDRVDSYSAVAQEKATLFAQGKEKKTVIYVPSSADDFVDYISLQERVSQKHIPIKDGEAVVTEKMAKTLGITTGDSFSLENDSGKRADFTVGGVCENYVESYVYMTENTYESAYGNLPEYSLMVAKVEDNSKENRDSISSDLLKISDVASVNFTEDIKSSFNDMLTNITYIVMVLIISAGALAFIVLYNLTNINITERQRELATIKVLGFYDREVSAYIYRETVIMSILGTIVGLGLGILLHRFVVVTAEVDMVMFGRTIYPMSFVYSAGLTMLFSMLVNLFMNRKMRKIDMIESLKANE